MACGTRKRVADLRPEAKATWWDRLYGQAPSVGRRILDPIAHPYFTVRGHPPPPDRKLSMTCGEMEAEAHGCWAPSATPGRVWLDFACRRRWKTPACGGRRERDGSTGSWPAGETGEPSISHVVSLVTEQNETVYPAPLSQTPDTENHHRETLAVLS